MEKLIGKDRVFDWRKFCIHLILCRQLLHPACSDHEGRSSSARAVAAQCVSCHSRSSCLWATGLQQDHCGNLCAWYGVWALICLLENLDRRVEGSVMFLFCVSRVSPMQDHSVPVKGQKAGIRNKSDVWEQSSQVSNTKLLDHHTTAGGSVGSSGD